MRAMLWGGLTLLIYVLIVVVNLWFSPTHLPIFWRILEYTLLAAVLLAFLARQLPRSGSLIWRPVMLFGAAAMAAAEVFAWSRHLQQPFSSDQWMTALLGLAGVAILARILPRPWLAAWFGTPFFDHRAVQERGE